MNVKDRILLEKTYDAVLSSQKKRLLPSIFAIKEERTPKMEQLLELLNRGKLKLEDFSGYFNHMLFKNKDIKYEQIQNRLRHIQ